MREYKEAAWMKSLINPEPLHQLRALHNREQTSACVIGTSIKNTYHYIITPVDP